MSSTTTDGNFVSTTVQCQVVLLLTHKCYWDIYLASRLLSVLWLCLNILWLLVCNPCRKKERKKKESVPHNLMKANFITAYHCFRVFNDNTISIKMSSLYHAVDESLWHTEADTDKLCLAECCCSLMLLLPLGCSSAIDKLDQVSFLINWSNDLNLQSD